MRNTPDIARILPGYCPRISTIVDRTGGNIHYNGYCLYSNDGNIHYNGYSGILRGRIFQDLGRNTHVGDGGGRGLAASRLTFLDGLFS